MWRGIERSFGKAKFSFGTQKRTLALLQKRSAPRHQREKPFIKNKFSRKSALYYYPVTTVISAFRSMA